MYNQTDAVLSQYEIEISEILRGRGSHICHTDQGMKVLVPFKGSKEKGEFLKEYLYLVREAGFPVEQIMANAKGEAVTEDEVTGERFILKDHRTGTELNVGRIRELEQAVKLLAEYHRISQRLQIEVPEKMKESPGSVILNRQKHNKELVKVKNYIRNRKKKTEFEQIYMKQFAPMMETAQNSLLYLQNQAAADAVCDVCHGAFHQHNVICDNDTWHMIHFESFSYTWSVVDLANFLRKIMEKNSWDIFIGMHLIETYDGVCSLGKDGMSQLYGLLLFPEKFWKVTNHYINSRKSWISERDIDKLKKVIEQEDQRLKFMENLFSNL